MTNGCMNARIANVSLTVRRRAWHTKNTAGVLQAIPASDAGAQGITQRIASHAHIAGDIVCNKGKTGRIHLSVFCNPNKK